MVVAGHLVGTGNAIGRRKGYFYSVCLTEELTLAPKRRPKW
jgi:hypothetical protein